MPPRILKDAETIPIQGLDEFGNYLESRIIGQPRAIRQILRAANLAGAKLLPDWRPPLVVIFAGPSGVGKTETVYAIADYLYLSEKYFGIEKSKPPLVEIPCGNYAGSLHFGVTELIGAPAGYVGSRGAGQGASEPKLIYKNFPPDRITVALFDEIDKVFGYGASNAEMLGILVQLLDKGELINNWDKNVKVNFRKSLIFFTANLAAKKIEKEAANLGIGFHTPLVEGGGDDTDEEEIARINERIYSITKDEYEKAFPPELRNRIDRLVVFRFLTREDFSKVLEKELAALRQGLLTKHRIAKIDLSEKAKEWLLRYGIVREYGVRSLQRAILRKVADPIATYLNTDLIGEGSKLYIDIDKLDKREGKFLFSHEK